MAKDTAANLCRLRRVDIRILLEKLTKAIEEYASKGVKDGKNYGYAGSLGHVQDKLQETLDFMEG